MKKKLRQKNLFCVGKSVIRKDAESKVTGRALYIDDLSFRGMFHACAVRSPRPHIRIRRISDEAARNIPGYVRLITFRDITGKNIWPVVLTDNPFFPETFARFASETIAIAVAETKESAVKAAGLVTVEFDELPYVDDPLRSMEPGAPRLYGDDNIFTRYVIRRGDADAAFKTADAVVENIYETNYQEHAYLETQGVIAVPEGDRNITIHGSMQCPFYVTDAVSQALGIPMNSVRVVQSVTGGGFGGKEEVPALVAAHAAITAWAVKRPVKLIYDREEDMRSMSKRHPSWTKIAYGAAKDGTITACRIRYVLDAGAYATLSPIVLWRGAVHAAGPYAIENVDIEALAVSTNRVPCGAFRGFGQPQICFANESAIDELAQKIGIDPIELRIKNALKPDTATASGQIVDRSCGLTEALQKVRTASGWKRKFRNKSSGKVRRGIGASANFYGVSLGARGSYLDRAGALVTVNRDGSVLASIGNTEMGQGAFTVIAQICAETLNAPYQSVRVSEVDTARVPDSGPTVASRTTLMSGNAIIEACKPIREKIFHTASDLLGKLGADISREFTATDGIFRSGDFSVTFAEAVKECWGKRLKMSEEGWYVSPQTSFNLSDGQGRPYVTYAWSANVAEVEVDTETGIVKVIRMFSAHDIGKAINPVQVEGQIQGGNLQAIGFALYENLQLRNGIMVNPNLSDYVLPTAKDTCEFIPIIIEKGYRAGPYHAKGFGECPLIGPAPAIANAIYNAAGVRLRRLPMIPERVWEAIQKL
jgi:CO/xanthine dehydrogenase Mo-binding subunit